jgi:Phasin protein
MQGNKGVARSKDYQMETKGKRSGRSAAPPENPVPKAAPAETPFHIRPHEATEPNPVVAPSRPDAVVQRVGSLVPAISATRGELADFGREALTAIDESRAAMARGFDALSEEITGLARGGIDTAVRTAIEMFAVRSFADAIAVNVSFARASFDNWIGVSAKFSELGVKLAVESSRPFLTRLGKSRSFAARSGG